MWQRSSGGAKHLYLCFPLSGNSKYKMRCTQLLLCAIIVLVLLGHTSAESKYRTPARILAKQTGATQFEEERFEAHTNCNEHKHHLKKRASDEDVDYEVYQGVVGRPGIDFPIYPRIPKTSFSCRSYGNGYFADMETDCQVFHICEEGRKISFLCPNGTIFQQSELTCDWWFKVNCLGSSGYYAESAEILNKQRVHRVRPSVPVQGFNIVGGGLNIKPKVIPVAGQGRSGPRANPDRRIDSTEDVPASVESVDFDDVSGEKQRKVLPSIDNNSNDHESQITAESSSFVSGSGKRRTNKENSPNRNEDITVLKPARNRTPVASQERGVSTERARNGQRGQHRYSGSEEHSKEREKPTPGQSKEKPEFFEAHSTRSVPQTTAHYSTGSHSTVRRLEPSKSTPFYTPTVPSLVKSKSTEGKLNYIKGGHVATTPNPHRFGSSSSGIFIESSTAPKLKPTASASIELGSTFKPVIIGMRHHYDVASSGEFRSPSKSTESRDYLPTTPSPSAASSGPTYLPKSGKSPRDNTGGAAGEDVLLFAPNPAKEESVYRNVQDMLKTMNLLKNQFEDVELNAAAAAPARVGLEIPPSSGPDALVSFAKYFAQEHNETINSLSKKDKSEKVDKTDVQTKLSVKPPPLPTIKPSDTTALLTTSENPPAISDNADDIKKSLLSDTTVKKYSNLFGLKSAQGRGAGESDISAGLLSNQANGTQSEAGPRHDQFPQIGSTGSTIGALADKPETRKIAQIFSNALSSYLDNPATWEDIFRSYDIPRDALPSSGGLQRIANKLFGGLNEQEALHLRNVMAKAEHDRQVLSLLLLLIQTCDDHNGKALERSRKHLLNALIDIDSKTPAGGKTSRQRLTTTNRIPVTTFRRGGAAAADYFTSTTPGYTTTTDLPTTTGLGAGSYEETTKFEIRVEDLEETTTTTAPLLEVNSDRRALELLKSLYSLASKFSSRR
ncbi:uncharacterized protein Dyak_GE24913 [Drosophila yakuba]|uniref:Chitin-binding type-2 domain-containing protein n=1 Tax=Drosophila yakuba TaxID=7245 RepID=B4PRZ2_DROYA|nr:uncharacterized protein Dyak_GE24913 [Drosophila yakuba]